VIIPVRNIYLKVSVAGNDADWLRGALLQNAGKFREVMINKFILLGSRHVKGYLHEPIDTDPIRYCELRPSI